MMSRCRLYHIGRGFIPGGVGKKALGLRFLVRKGFAVPDTYVLLPSVCTLLNQNDTDKRDRIEDILIRRLGNEVPFAVRSSAAIEDQPESSYAGQFLSVLSVCGVRSIMNAVEQVCRSAPRVENSTYHQRNAARCECSVAVIIQRMVVPMLSGVTFSRNPVTGLREIVVEAVPGSGELLAQDGITPERWRYKWGSFIEKPGNDSSWQGVVNQVVEGVKRIDKVFGRPADLEWVWDGRKLWWVQLREMTGLEDITIFSNRISREFLPGLIKPLVWSVNIPVVNTAWIRLLEELTGPSGIRPEDLARSFHYRAYFNMSTLGKAFEMMGFPHESLELLLGIESPGPEKPSFKPSLKTISLLPRMACWTLKKMRLGRETGLFIRDMKEKLQAIMQRDMTTMSEDDLLKTIDDLQELVIDTAYYNVVVPLFMQLYSYLLKGKAEKAGLQPQELEACLHDDRVREIDPRFHVARLHRRYLDLDPELRSDLEEQGYSALHGPELSEFRAHIERFISRFGHFSDSGNDFSSVPWREQPAKVLRMVMEHGDSGNEETERPVLQPRIPGRLSSFLFSRTREFRLLREHISSLYTFGYGMFRPFYLELGRRLKERGVFAAAEDVLYLTRDETAELVRNGGFDAAGIVSQQRQKMRAAEDAKLPSILFGDDSPPIYDHVGSHLKGIPTSRGYYRGPVRVIRKTEESGTLQRGDVLVIPFSDVGWTPLFARAGAVISEAGGILSHSSIIAREYGIPAVVSVQGALELNDGSQVTVDGYTGEIITEEALK